MPAGDRFKEAIKRSVELSKAGEDYEALKLLDESIASAIREKQVPWIITLSRHAAVISDFIGDTDRRKRYYEQCLQFEPEDPLALYGLAEVAHKEGDAELARKYAARCHKAIVEGDDELAKQGLLDLVAKRWPEVTGS